MTTERSMSMEEAAEGAGIGEMFRRMPAQRIRSETLRSSAISVPSSFDLAACSAETASEDVAMETRHVVKDELERTSWMTGKLSSVRT